jgi:Bacterial Ig domain
VEVRKLFSACVVFSLSAGCGPLGLESTSGVDAGRAPFDARAILGEFDDEAGLLPARAPSIQILNPSAGAVVLAPLAIAGTAIDDTGVASVAIRVGPNQPRYAVSGDSFRSWTFSANVPVGNFAVVATARDLEGNESAPARVQLSNPSDAPDDAPPTLLIQSPADGSSPLQQLALVRGIASDDRAVVSVELTRNGVAMTEREVETDDFFASWSRSVPLLPGETNTLVFTARDAAGHTTSAQLELQGRASTDRSAPTVELSTPGEGAQFSGTTLDVRGRANDDVGIREVKARIGRVLPGASELVWGAYQAVQTSDGYANFSLTLDAPSGPFQLEVRAIDLSGLSGSLTRSVVNGYIPVYSPEVLLPLRVHAQVTAPALNFSLTRSGIDEVFTESIQRDIRLLELDTTALITDAVNKIKSSCGLLWQQNNANPRHDCSATDYGKDRTPAIPWQQTPEYAMVRLLTMTAANVVVAGTSLGNLQSLADALGIGGGFHQILADTFGTPITQEVVQTASVVRALQEFWLQTHPNVLPGAKLPITLYDGMHELSPLAERFGPAGGHPGLLDPAFPPRSVLLTPQFEMRLVARSNLQWMDGVDTTGSGGDAKKDYLALVVDTTGPSFDDVLEFDFTDPARFDVVGLVAAPKADMRMLLRENPAFVRTCTNNAAACKANLPASPLTGYVWANPRHQIESVVAGAAYFQYQNRRNYTKTYNLLIPAATVTVGSGGNPAGWSTFETLVNLGDPPPPQYLWETISEVGQVALHNFGGATLPEGGVNVAFSLTNINVGLTADGIRSAMRPALQDQRRELSDRLLGDYQKNNGAVDFFYRLGADNKPYLYFVAASDPRSVAGYGYATPGFFADEALTLKQSSTAAGTSGDSAHEKLALTPNTTTVSYIKDDTGALVKLRFVVPADSTEIEVYVSRKAR